MECWDAPRWEAGLNRVVENYESLGEFWFEWLGTPDSSKCPAFVQLVSYVDPLPKKEVFTMENQVFPKCHEQNRYFE